VRAGNKAGEGTQMQCPYCLIHFHDNWQSDIVCRDGRHAAPDYVVRNALCPNCKKHTIELRHTQAEEWVRVLPRGSSRPPVPVEVPKRIAKDYTEACEVLPLSAKASAALSRRCLQTMLHDHGYKARDLAKEIQLILDEKDTTKAIPVTLRQSIDAIRHYGNFSAHPITDVMTLQVIDVEPGEAEQCLETTEEMFQHFYVLPELAKQRKVQLDAKLAKAGKPPSKS
jgi:hypothetical protein